MMFPPFGNEFLSPSKIFILKLHSIIYPLKQKEMCDYNPRCFMSSGLVFDDIIMNMICNKELRYHQEGVDSLFTNIEHKSISMSGGYFKTFTGRKELMKVLVFHVYISMLKESQ